MTTVITSTSKNTSPHLVSLNLTPTNVKQSIIIIIMATKSKLANERQRLINTYVDVVVFQYFDKKDKRHLGDVRLSKIGISCRADVPALERHLISDRPAKKLYVEMPKTNEK